MLASKQFGCKAFFQSLILVVLCPLSSFVTIKFLLRFPQIQLLGRGPSMQRSTFTTSRSQCMTGPYLHQEIFKKEVRLPSFTFGGEFIRVIQTTFNVQLEGGFSHWIFPLFLSQFVFEHCFSFSIVQGDLWPYFQGPYNFYAFMFSNSS